MNEIQRAGDQDSRLAVSIDLDRRIIDAWLHDRPERTRAAYQDSVDRLFKYAPKTLGGMNLEDLQRFSDHLALAMADSSRKRHLAAIKSLFSFASKLFPVYIRGNPSAAIRLPGSDDTLNQKILSRQQVMKLFEAATLTRDRQLLELLYWAGMRREEAVALQHDHCQPANDGAPGGLISIFGKGKKNRVVRIDGEAWQHLRIYLLVRSHPSSPWVFAGRDGKHLSISQGWRIVKAVAIKAGLAKNVSPHFLRHSIATHVFDAGWSVREVQYFLGHESAKTTERYIHSRPRRAAGDCVRADSSGVTPNSTPANGGERDAT
jgi:integrase/recombinase XerD